MNNTEPKISVITAVYNTPLEFLKECFESIKNQSYKNIEYIIIDDGSKKEIADFCDFFWEKEKTLIDVKIVHNENHGVSYSRNCGLDMAVGEYIVFVDSDDALDVNFVSLMLKTAEILSCKIVVSDYSTTKIEKISDSNIKTLKSTVKSYSGASIWENLNTSYIWRTLYSHEIVRNIRFNVNMKCCEDIVFFNSVLKNVDKVGYIPKKLYYYRQTVSSITHKLSLDVCSDSIRTYENIYLSNKYIIGNKKAYSEAFTNYTRWIIRYMVVTGREKSYSEFCHAKKMCISKTKGHIDLIKKKQVKVMATLLRLPSFMYYICIKLYDYMRIQKVLKARSK